MEMIDGARPREGRRRGDPRPRRWAGISGVVSLTREDAPSTPTIVPGGVEARDEAFPDGCKAGEFNELAADQLTG